MLHRILNGKGGWRNSHVYAGCALKPDFGLSGMRIFLGTPSHSPKNTVSFFPAQTKRATPKGGSFPGIMPAIT